MRYLKDLVLCVSCLFFFILFSLFVCLFFVNFDLRVYV